MCQHDIPNKFHSCWGLMARSELAMYQSCLSPKDPCFAPVDWISREGGITKGKYQNVCDQPHSIPEVEWGTETNSSPLVTGKGEEAGRAWRWKMSTKPHCLWPVCVFSCSPLFPNLNRSFLSPFHAEGIFLFCCWLHLEHSTSPRQGRADRLHLLAVCCLMSLGQSQLRAAHSSSRNL